MTEKELMITGKMYDPNDPELLAGRVNARRVMRQLNAINPMTGGADRLAIFRKFFGATGERCYLENAFCCDYGYNIYLGEDFYANFNCILLDVAPIRIGKNAMFAPNVQLYTATHPLLAAERNSGREYAKPITIGDNVWLGGGVIVNPGVTIGDDVVIGSGSVVTRDVPSGVFAAGNPCRVVREISG